MDRMIKIVFCLFVAVSAALLWQVVRSGPSSNRSPEITYSTFIEEAEAGKIARVSIVGSRIEGEYRDGHGAFRLTGPNNPGVYLSILQNNSVEIRFKDGTTENVALQLIGSWAPLILLAALWFFMTRQFRRKNPPIPPAGTGTIDPTGGLR
jgi:cell division protease FtsH